ncbi:hypothetical protein K492DRAFT_235187 [Lichtheimia hyalospora FSU 10163]|nr:hypothetical protein K492DRAFT_235187 [Lichtheimia hyalospora FSU 10163]
MLTAALRSSAIRGARCAHTASSIVPKPRGAIKEPADFLAAIGRGCDEHASKFETWESLFTTDSRTMRNDFGIPTRQRKYILSWREMYRQGRNLTSISESKKKK